MYKTEHVKNKNGRVVNPIKWCEIELNIEI
jgi:hypothetical protein